MFSKQDIQHINALVCSSDPNNNLLAFELIKSQPLVASLYTSLYLLYNRFELLENQEAHQEAEAYLQQFIQQKQANFSAIPLRVTNLLEYVPYSFKKDIHDQFYNFDQLIPLDKRLITEAIPNYLEQRYWGKGLAGFMYKYSHPAKQKEYINLLKSKDYTGRLQLDLGGLKLRKVPNLAFADAKVQVLELWGNELTELPDSFEALPKLEILNIAENDLAALPPSIQQLSRLQQLFAKENPLKIDPFIELLRGLPNLKRLDIMSKRYRPTDTQKIDRFQFLLKANLLQAPKREQHLALFLYLKNQQARGQLRLKDFFWGANHQSLDVRKKSLDYLYAIGSNSPIEAGSQVALLGKMSQQINLHYDWLKAQLKKQEVGLSRALSTNTTVVVVGEFPKGYEALPTLCSFLSEAQFLAQIQDQFNLQIP